MRKQPAKMKRVWNNIFLGVLIFILFLGFSVWNLFIQDQKKRDEIIKTAEYIAQTIDADLVLQLRGGPEDQSTLNYQRLKEHLMATRRMYPDVRFLYLIGENEDGRIFFYIDSEAPGSPDESLPGDIYEEETKYEIEILRSGTPLALGPGKDAWGTWITAFQPIRDPLSGEVFAAFGMDIDAGNWLTQIAKAALLPIILFMSLIVIVTGTIHVHRYRQENPETYRRRFITRYALVFCTGLLGACLTALFAWYFVFYEKIATQESFTRLAESDAERVLLALGSLEESSLESLRQFYQGSEYVDRDEFSRFTEHLLNDPFISALAWIPAVQENEYPNLLSEARQDGLADFQIWKKASSGKIVPSLPKDIQFPVFYISPHDPQNPILGYDLSTDEYLLEFVIESMDSGLTTATDLFPLNQPEGELEVMMVFMPVPGTGNDSDQTGVIAGIIIPDLILNPNDPEEITSSEVLYTDIILVDAVQDPILLSSSSPEIVRQSHLKVSLQEHTGFDLALVKPFTLFEKTYMIISHPSPEFYKMNPVSGGAIVSIAGSILALLCMVLVGNFADRNYILSDMVNQRTAELANSEQKFQIALKNSPIFVYQQDLDLKFTWIYELSSCFKSQDILGLTDYDIMLENEADKMTRIKRKVLASGEGAHETFQTTLDGTTFHHDMTIEPVFGGQGEVTGIICSSVDITDLVLQQEEINRTNTRLRKIYELSQYDTQDIQDFIDFALNAAIELTESEFGYIYFYNEKTELFTLNSWSNEVMQACTVQDPQSIYELEKTGIWGEAVRQRQPILVNDFSAPHPLKKGYPEGHVDLKKFLTIPIFMSDEIVAVVGVANKADDYNDADILQLNLLMDSVWKMVNKKEAELALRESTARFRQLVENAPEPIFVQTEHKFVYLNPAALEAFDAADDSQLLGTPVIDRFHPDFHAIVQQRIQGLNLEKQDAPLIEEIYLRVDGSPFDVEVSAVPIHWEDHDGALVFFRDITERKQAEQLRERRLAELDALSRITNTLNAALTVNQALPLLLNETLKVLEMPSGSISLYNPATQKINMVAASGWLKDLKGIPVTPDKGIAGSAFSTQQTFITHDYVSDPRVNPEIKHIIPPGWGGASIPIQTMNRTIGVLTVSCELPRRIQPEELHLLESLAHVAGITIHRLGLLEETIKQLEIMEAQRNIEQAIAGLNDLQKTLNIICEQALYRFPADAVGILLYDPDNQSLAYAAGHGFNTSIYERSHCKMGKPYAGQAALEARIIQIDDLKSENRLSNRNSLAVEEEFLCYTGVPLIAKGQIMGVMEIFHRNPFDHTEDWFQHVQSIGSQTSIAIDDLRLYESLRQKNRELIQAYDATIEGWSMALELRDQETEGHTLRVAAKTLQLAKAMGIGEDDLVQVRRGALLHDIGKLGIPDAILLKPGKLTDEEWVIMKQHPIYAYEMLAPISYLETALDIPYCHHEKWDGSGYPRGLKGEDIPLAARIFAIIDVWDALRSDRPYRKAWPEEKVRDHIRSLSGSHFDPEVVKAFFDHVESFADDLS